MIPRILHAWWGGPELPAEGRSHLAAWQEMHPEWELKLWTPETTPRLRHQDLYDNPAKYSPKSNIWQWRSDLARYEILLDEGGVYIDCDLRPLRPIDELITEKAFSGGECGTELEEVGSRRQGHDNISSRVANLAARSLPSLCARRAP